MATFPIFDASTQEVVDHELTVDAAGEVIATSPSGRMLKFPAGLTKEEFEAAVAAHEEANKGHVVLSPEVLAEQEAKLQASNDLLASLEAPAAPAADAPAE